MININFEDLGYLKVEKNIFKLNSKILREFEEIFRKNKSCWKNTSVINNLVTITNYQSLNLLFEKIEKIIKHNHLQDKLKFDDIWFSESEKITYKKGELPNIPHIDKIRKFKVMIYLNDVFEKNGPLFLANCNTIKYEELRKNLKKDYKKNLDNKIEDIPLNEYLPMTGEFGTTIFFDTNTPHFAGPFLENNIKRKIIRFNFRYI